MYTNNFACMFKVARAVIILNNESHHTNITALVSQHFEQAGASLRDTSYCTVEYVFNLLYSFSSNNFCEP